MQLKAYNCIFFEFVMHSVEILLWRPCSLQLKKKTDNSKNHAQTTLLLQYTLFCLSQSDIRPRCRYLALTTFYVKALCTINSFGAASYTNQPSRQ